MNTLQTNWAGNYHYNARRLHFPKTIAELQQIVRTSSRVKALGTRHSFNAIADTTGEQISLRHFDRMELDRAANSVTVGAGVNYGQLAPYLYANGYALHNLASLPHIGVVGACATGTHGSGVKNAGLAAAASAIELVTGTGDLVTLSSERDREQFQGVVVGLGALGVVTCITLQLQPAFDVQQAVYENLSFDELQANLEEIFSSGYSVSLFTGWQQNRAAQVWRKLRAAATFASEFFGARLATQKQHPLPGHPAEHCTEQFGLPGPWHDRLPHFRMEFTPSSGAELQSEYFVPRAQGYQAIRAIEALADRIAPHLFVTELRAIAADDFWMSPCYRCDSLGIHFTWKPEWEAVRALLPLIEEQLAAFQARPHWAKLFTMQRPELEAVYPKLPDFRALVARYDPQRKFRNAFLAAVC